MISRKVRQNLDEQLKKKNELQDLAGKYELQMNFYNSKNNKGETIFFSCEEN